MDNLPTTYQGMVDYIRAAAKQVKRNKQNIEDLEIAIMTLTPKILEIEKQLKENQNATL